MTGPQHLLRGFRFGGRLHDARLFHLSVGCGSWARRLTQRRRCHPLADAPGQRLGLHRL
jgi:hypothetical protein